MLVSIPFTLKNYPESLDKVKMGNDFACLPFELKFPKIRDISSFKSLLAN
jgi:hypothetical protein